MLFNWPHRMSAALQLPCLVAWLLGCCAGELRVRRLSVQQVKQSDKIRLLGHCCHADPLEAAAAFNRCVDTWSATLQVCFSSCVVQGFRHIQITAAAARA
jgi:hypothetical protein